MSPPPIPNAEPATDGARPEESGRPATRPPDPRLRYRLHILAGALALALYLTLLTRNDIDAWMGRGAIPALPGGWKTIAAALVVALAAVAAATAWQGGSSLTAVRRWVAAHPALILISGVTLGALALRVFGISDNLPYVNHPDEPAVADRALHILQTGDYNPHYFVYPNLYTYLVAALDLVRFFVLVSNGTLERLDQIVPTDFYLWDRLLTAALGTLTVPLVYLAGRRLYGSTVGLVAAVFMASNNVHVLNSQLITTDAPATFFSALALAAIVWLLPAEFEQTAPASLRRYIAAGAAVGLAVGTKYNSALVVLPFLLAHGYAVAAGRPRDLGEGVRRFFGGRLWAGLAALAGAFFLTTPFALFDLPNFLNELASVVAHYRYGHTGHESDENWLFYVSSFLGSDFWPTALTLAGMALAFLRRRRADVLLLAFPLVFYFSMSNYRVNFEHNLLPILPFTSILAALPLVLGWRLLTVRLLTVPQAPDRRLLRNAAQVILAGLVVVAVAGPVTASAQRDYLHAQPDNRVRAARWFDANTRPGTKIWLEDLTPQLTPGRYLATYGKYAIDQPMSWYVANRYEYVVLSAGTYKDAVYDHPDSNPRLRDAYLRFFQDNQSRLVVEFRKNEVDAPGPTISIYRTGYSPTDWSCRRAAPASVERELWGRRGQRRHVPSPRRRLSPDGDRREHTTVGALLAGRHDARGGLYRVRSPD